MKTYLKFGWFLWADITNHRNLLGDLTPKSHAAEMDVATQGNIHSET